MAKVSVVRQRVKVSISPEVWRQIRVRAASLSQTPGQVVEEAWIRSWAGSPPDPMKDPR